MPRKSKDKKERRQKNKKEESEAEESEVEEPVEVAEVNKVEEEKVDEEKPAWEKCVQDLLEKEKELTSLARAVTSLTRDLQKAVKKEINIAKKSKRGKNRGNGNKTQSGFTKPSPVPQTICKFLGLDDGTELPRPTVTKKIYEYIKENDLKDEENKKIIHPDKALKKLFKLDAKEVIKFENFQKHLSKVYKAEKEKTVSSSA